MSSEMGPGKSWSRSVLLKLPANKLTAFYVKTTLGSGTFFRTLGARDESGSVSRLWTVDKLSPWYERRCRTSGWTPWNSLSRGRGCHRTAQIIYSEKQMWHFQSVIYMLKKSVWQVNVSFASKAFNHLWPFRFHCHSCYTALVGITLTNEKNINDSGVISYLGWRARGSAIPLWDRVCWLRTTPFPYPFMSDLVIICHEAKKNCVTITVSEQFHTYQLTCVIRE